MNTAVRGCGRKPELVTRWCIIHLSLLGPKKAVELYIKYDQCAASAVREL